MWLVPYTVWRWWLEETLTFSWELRNVAKLGQVCDFVTRETEMTRKQNLGKACVGIH